MTSSRCCGGNKSFPLTTLEEGNLVSDIRKVRADVGVDIRRPKKIYAKKFRLADARDLSIFADKEFDNGFYSHILEHLPTMLDLAKALKEAKRVCHHIDIWLPNVVSWGNTNKDHHLVWLKGLRPFNKVFRSLLWLFFLILLNRYPRCGVKKVAHRIFGVTDERHLSLDMDNLSLEDLKRVFQGKAVKP